MKDEIKKEKVKGEVKSEIKSERAIKHENLVKTEKV